MNYDKYCRRYDEYNCWTDNDRKLSNEEFSNITKQSEFMDTAIGHKNGKLEIMITRKFKDFSSIPDVKIFHFAYCKDKEYIIRGKF